MMETIDFAAFGSYMKSLPNQRRTNVIKYIHNWQNTGRQKQKFLISKKTDGDNVEEWDNTKCPHGCGEIEAAQHYLTCTACPHHRNKRQHLMGLRNWMTKSLTMPPLQILLLRALTDWLHGRQSQTHEITETDTDHMLIKEALVEQDLIGWDHFLKGRISKKWAIIQNKCYSRLRQESESNNLSPIPTYLDGKWWAKKVITLTIYMCLNLWQIRNETLAANNEKLNHISKRNELLKQALNLQQQALSETTRNSFASTFACSYATLTTYTNERLHRWISMALRAINYDPNLAGGQRTIRAITILPPRTPDNRISENRPPDNQTVPQARIHDNRTHDNPLPGGAT